MNIIKAHGLLGHVNGDLTQQTAKHLGWIIACGKLKPFIHCARSKDKQKNFCKSSQSPKVIEPGERVYLDLSKVTVSRSNGSELELKQKGWKRFVDEATRKKWCEFTQTKSVMVERTYEFHHAPKQRKITIKIIRLDPVDAMPL